MCRCGTEERTSGFRFLQDTTLQPGGESLSKRRFAMAKVNPIPEGCHSVQPYMMFAGCAKAMEFYAKAFGAREVMCMKGPDGLVGHAEMQIGDSRIMMSDEAPQMDAYGVKHYGGSPI